MNQPGDLLRGSAMRPKVCVLGLGYIGLPTASMFAVSGHDVIGVDPSPRVHEALGNGRSHLEEPGLQALVSAALNSGRLRVQVAPEPADIFILTVPSPLDSATETADLTYVERAARSVVPHLSPGALVILESTVPPGTTRNTLAPILVGAGLEVGRNLYVAHCPERVLPGRIVLELVQNDRLIGGLTAESTERAADLYASFVQGAIISTDAETAEMAKLMENTFRDVNVALANEFALIAERIGVDVWQAIELANRHPRVNILRPGPGVGGHCIAVDPWFLVQDAASEARVTVAARRVNDGMPGRVLEHLERLTPPPATAALLGVAYKAGVDDVRESPALRVAELAVERGYDVRLCDPYVNQSAALVAPLMPLGPALRNADVVVLLVDHPIFKDLDVEFVGGLVRRKRLLDTRSVLNHGAWRARDFVVDVLGNGAQTNPLPPRAPSSIGAAISSRGGHSAKHRSIEVR